MAVFLGLDPDVLEGVDGDEGWVEPRGRDPGSMSSQTESHISVPQFMADLQFEEFVEPIRSGRCGPEDLGVLWKHSQDRFRQGLNRLYLRYNAESRVRFFFSSPWHCQFRRGFKLHRPSTFVLLECVRGLAIRL